ncbi:MAG: hypothetical protein AAGC97_13140, partial [Planctomycetota bacterium]
WRDWRLYRKYADDKWQLFDLNKDPREESDLASTQRDVVEQMATKHAQWAETLAPLAQIPKTSREAQTVPSGHGWAFATIRSITGSD